MLCRIIVSTLLAVVVLRASAEPNVLSDIDVSSSYSDVLSLHVNGYYVMLYVTNATSSTFYEYRIGLYQLVNGTTLIRHNLQGSVDFQIRSTNRNLELSEKEDFYPQGVVAVVIVCSSMECSELFVTLSTVTLIPQPPAWCGKNFLTDDKLLSEARNLNHIMSVVFRQTELFAFLCLPDATDRTIKLTCDGNLDISTTIHSVESTITTSSVNVFVLLSKGQETKLCSFTKTIGDLTDNTENTVAHSSILLFSYKPTALAVSTVSSTSADHIAFASSSSGRVSKVRN